MVDIAYLYSQHASTSIFARVANRNDQEIQINISHDGNAPHLEMLVSSSTAQQVHQLSLTQARTLSMEIIKQVYLAELRNRTCQSVAREAAVQS